MRRCAVWMVLVVLCLTAGCRGSAPAAEPVGEQFTCTIQALYRDLAVEGTLTRATAGTLTLEFDKPDTLKGLTVRWDGDTVKLSMLGLDFSIDPNTVPESALGKEIIAALDTALRGEGERKLTDGKLVVAGNGANGAYELVCDGNSGVPLSLSVPSLPLTVTFSNFQSKS